jgi:hypothetical protein
LRRRGFLAQAAWLGCAACAPEMPRARPTTASRPRAAQPAFPLAAMEGSLRCSEGMPADGPAARRRRGEPPLAVLPTADTARVYRVADLYGRVAVRYWPLNLLANSPEDAAGTPGGRGATRAQHPAHVVEAGAAALRALRIFRAAGFDPPKLAAGGILWVELRDLVVRGQTTPEDDFIAVERTLRGPSQASTIAHEIFHRVQYAYVETKGAADAANNEDEPGFTGAIIEGGARMAELMMGADAPGYEQDAHEWFLPQAISLSRSRRGRRRAVLGASYQAALFWKYIAEQHGPRDPAAAARPGLREAETQRRLLEACRMPVSEQFPVLTITHLRRARSNMRGVGDFDRFLYLNGERAIPACAETSWGNFLLALALNGSAGEDSRFRFEDAQRWRGLVAGRATIPPLRQAHFDTLPSENPETIRLEPAAGLGVFGPEMLAGILVDEDFADARIGLRAALGLGGAAMPTGDERPIPTRLLAPYSMLAFKLTMPGGNETRLLRIRWEPAPELRDGFVQIAFLNEAGELQDLFRHDGHDATPLQRVFGCAGLSEVLVIVASREHGGNFRLRFDEPMEAPVLMAGDWNCEIGRFITRDPARYSHNWQSPSAALYVDGPADRAQGVVSALFFNRGTRRADGVTFTCHRRPISGGPWQALPPEPTPPPSTLETADECQRLFLETPLTEDLIGTTPPPAPCIYFANGLRRLPSPADNAQVIQFTWPPGDPRSHVVRITAQAPEDPNGPCVIHTIFGGSPPPMRPL